ncbi:MAG: exosortase/archaeosortase family protein [Chthoniobacterales bacterium]|nr:exosortase/archaeosortase family protein [Chthoniobacterales bacterium]
MMEQLKEFGGFMRSLGEWGRRQPTQAFIFGALIATGVYFFGFLGLFIKGTYVQGVASVMGWAWQAWNPLANQEHSKLVPLIFFILVWLARDKIRRAPKAGANFGLVFVGMGVALFLVAARCLQPRMALLAIPFLIYGSVRYLWGGAVARILLFPCVFLLFMIPVAALEQATFRLQFAITGIIGVLSNLVGIEIQAVGTTLSAMDNSFDFQIAEGCSGIRSLTAMTMLTAIYVHLTQKEIWKKFVIVIFSIGFALVGNVGRVFTVILVAKWIDPKLASGIYHDYSGYIFFPIALMAMLGFSKLLNLRSADGAENSSK